MKVSQAYSYSKAGYAPENVSDSILHDPATTSASLGMYYDVLVLTAYLADPTPSIFGFEG